MSGYQESFVPVQHLAQAAGIRDAVTKYHKKEGCGHWYCCTTETIDSESRSRGPFGESGKLFVCLAGERCPYTRTGSWMLDDMSFNAEDYPKYFNDLDDALLNEAALERPDLRDLAYEDWSRYLAHVWE